jgi:UDP-4-amino-4-deoxy-L-arabinose formyltransferase/UDP-glucuronic acid dehydrogenase (UDP-4-keto-hexauronic acid decarboxylating)
MAILENKDGKADGGIFNIGNPKNDHSVREVAEMLRELWEKHPKRKAMGVELSPIVETSSGDFYGKGYQDVLTRTPSIQRMKDTFGFDPKIGMKQSLATSLDFFLQEYEAMEQVAEEQG